MARRRRPPRAGAITELPPLKILGQIVILQVLWYVIGTALILFTALVAGRSFSLDMVLSWRSLRGDTTVGWMLGFVWLLNSFIGVISLLLLVSRSKLIPDFTLTIHFIHLLITTLYSHSLPRNWLWWALQFVSTSLMTFLGIWSCQWRELRPINFGSSTNAAQNNSNTVTDNSGMERDISTGMEGEGDAQDTGDVEQGYGRGRGRGRGRDGAGNYEMVGMGIKADENTNHG
ncbi:hypothetical protein SBOR_1745 [Sclerotinia borealis F-4128]|uniref:Protein SYS1 n=1 Tax=Sclerotinia borealis (strain F-4128) TaxID=1432307 RepID=W9CTI3_SCLBF|nr:hypothetical protein SBOR_1745 [Sclerotinia borealis F-4128]